MQLSADQIELRFLGAVEVVDTLPVATAVDHPLVEHALVQVVADVVVSGRVGGGATNRLPVEDLCSQRHPNQVRGQLHPAPQVCGEDLREELVDPFGTPPTVLVCLAEAEFAVGENPPVEALIVYVKVARVGAVELHARRLEQLDHHSLCPLRVHTAA